MLMKHVEAQLVQIGLPEGFYYKLANEDDWSFVIKLNALVEAACTHALAANFHAPDLLENLSYLDLGNSKFGKVALLRRLDALTAPQARLLQWIYQLRNRIAHDIRNVTFSFTEHLAAFDKVQKDNYLSAVGHGIKETIILDSNKEYRGEELCLENPKLALWISTAEIIACLYLERELAPIRLRKKLAE